VWTSWFYYFRLEDQVPENHLRLIDKHINLEFVRERLKDSYSETGRPSIDPELVREQFFLAATAQNIKRLVRFLRQAPRSLLPATA
jgi:hypothetical protein